MLIALVALQLECHSHILEQIERFQYLPHLGEFKLHIACIDLLLNLWRQFSTKIPHFRVGLKVSASP